MTVVLYFAACGATSPPVTGYLMRRLCYREGSDAITQFGFSAIYRVGLEIPLILSAKGSATRGIYVPTRIVPREIKSGKGEAVYKQASGRSYGRQPSRNRYSLVSIKFCCS